MKFFVIDEKRHKIYLLLHHKIYCKSDIDASFKIHCHKCGIISFGRDEVIAEVDALNPIIFFMIMGFIGIFVGGGVYGLILIGGMGYLIAWNEKYKDELAVKRFNRKGT